MKILVLGNGILGAEISKQTNWPSLNRSIDGFDITRDLNKYSEKILSYDQVLNCIGYTDTYSMDKEPHWNINYKAVVELVDLCNKKNTKLIHISTDYLYANSLENASELDVPVHCQNWYGYTKLLADAYVQLKSNNFLLLRSTHKENPFPYDGGWTNQIGNFDYVNKIADLIIKLIKNDAHGIFNVGTEKKSMYQLAQRTKQDVEKIKFDEKTSIPKNVSMNLKKLKSFLKIK